METKPTTPTSRTIKAALVAVLIALVSLWIPVLLAEPANAQVRHNVTVAVTVTTNSTDPIWGPGPTVLFSFCNGIAYGEVAVGGTTTTTIPGCVGAVTGSPAETPAGCVWQHQTLTPSWHLQCSVPEPTPVLAVVVEAVEPSTVPDIPVTPVTPTIAPPTPAAPVLAPVADIWGPMHLILEPTVPVV